MRPMPAFLLHPCLEADSLFLRDLPLCQLRLQNNNAIPWLILVPRRPDITEIHQLEQRDRAQLTEEIAEISKILESRHKPDKLNIGALGNIVPQLHIHIIGRFKTDLAWPDPVWGRLQPSLYATDAMEEIKNFWSKVALLSPPPLGGGLGGG